MITKPVEQAGFTYIYLSNESNTTHDVYFDDLVITHTSANATLQADDYYPFGLPMEGSNSFLGAGVSKNRFLYQGKEWHTELGLNLYDFHARQFDPAIGRWLAIDPQDQFMSPYLGMGNVPTLMVDPDGEFGFLAAVAIGALLGSTSYTASVALSPGGFQNWDWGQFGLSAGIGAVSGSAAFGVGVAFKAAYGASLNFGQTALQSAAHGVTQGTIGAATGGDFLHSAASGFVGSMAGAGLNKVGGSLGAGGKLGLSALSGGVLGGAGSALTGGKFWTGFGKGAITATANHGLHAAANELENSALIRRIKKEGWSPIDLSENPHKATVEGYRVARLYSRGRLPQLNEQFPDGFRIQDLFDMSSIPVGSKGWTDMSGEKIGSIYMYKHKDMSIRIDSKSFNIGDVSTLNNNEIRLFDNSQYWTEHTISWIKYSSGAHGRWLGAINFINGKK